MEPEMSEQDKRTLLINSLMELEESTVLALVQERLAAGEDPLQILEDAQLGMQRVGERYEQRQYYISGMMMAGEIFREVMELAQPVLQQRLTGNESGHILLGTVQGDIHDIGKNIFSTLLRCHGFTVTDLGVDIPPARFVAEAARLQPDIIALSGLLTISYETMRATVQQIRQLPEAGAARTPFIIGGGVVNAMVCSFVGAEYWANDAMLGVHLCKQIIAERGGAAGKEI
jgi:methanogenic corrinoid protein MtbC1